VSNAEFDIGNDLCMTLFRDPLSW